MCLSLLLTGMAACAAENHVGDGSGDNRAGGGGGHSTGRSLSAASAGHSARPAQPIMIRMNHSNAAGNYRPGYQPSYSQTQRPHRTTASPAPAQQIAPGVRLANAAHHHTYTPGYVRQKLSKIGVKTEPRYITDRSEIVSTDQAHSRIGNPSTGPHGEAFHPSMVSARQFNSPVVRGQMVIASRPAFLQQIDRENIHETQRGHVYWHSGGGYDYAHYMDNSGYNWYGWNTGGQFFWTRNDSGRWWWYDTGYNRWCFYNDDYWWWQDPYHVGDLYVYDDDNYIAANSANDSIVVSGAETTNEAVYNSPDGTRTVKIVPGDGDAFLYDQSSAPAFDPIYLASGVQSMYYSDPQNGRPLEIVLKLNDGSYDMFDADGHPYHPDSPDTQ
jgi:hypothetical protein